MSKYLGLFKKGDIFGDFVVLEEVLTYRKGFASVSVKCSCGNVRKVDAHALLNGSSKRCNFCNGKNRSGPKNPSWRGYEEIPGKILSRLKRQAKERDISFNITLKDIWERYIFQNRLCNLTKLQIGFLEGTASVDRIDSEKDYSSNNIQIVHKDLNIMKNDFMQDYFIKMCRLVSEHEHACKNV